MALAPLEIPVPPALALRPLRVLMRGAWLQTLRCKEMFVLLLLLGLYAVAALVLRIVGIQSADGARFVAGLGFQLGSLLSTLLVLVSAARALPPELEQRTIYPVLAKPVLRAELLLGKAIPVWLAGAGGLGLFVLASSVIAPGLPYQHAVVLAQAVVAKLLALAMVAVLAMVLSLFIPTALNILTCGAYVLGSGLLINLVTQNGGAIGSKVALLLPDFSLFEHFQRYTDGGAQLGWGAMLGLLAYAAAWCTLLAGVAVRRFSRMAL